MYPTDVALREVLPKVMEGIKAHRCMFAYNGGNTTMAVLNAPEIYIASGLFSTNVTIGARESSSSIYRAEAAKKAFRDAGFHTILTKASPKMIDELAKTKIYADQHAYVDVLVLRKAACFVPSFPAVSSLSYVVERFRSFREGDFGGELERDHSFRSWGFRS